MKKILVSGLCALLAVCSVKAQSKVFKEVSDEISSEMKIITQDDALIGYLVFTQLEKASQDSFNYRISIMDENLNDIGKVNFREEKLDLQAVSFDQDVLCLAYLKSNVIGVNFNSNRAYKKANENAKNMIVTQFLNLDGKIIKTNAINAEIESYKTTTGSSTKTGYGHLKHDIQLKNIPQKGFACFYGDEKGNSLLAYDLSGKQLWKKSVADAKWGFAMLSSVDGIYLLTKKEDKMLEGGYSILAYDATDGSSREKYTLEDKKGNSLKVLAFENDPVTGKPYVSGNIINAKSDNNFNTGKGLSKGAYKGVFTINFTGGKKGGVKEIYSYWEDGSMQPTITEKGKYVDNNTYAKFYRSVRDYQGNTYFVGSSFSKQPKWGTITSAILLSPLVVVSPFILVSGTQKYKILDAVLVKQSPEGKLALDNAVPANNSRYFMGRIPFSQMDRRDFYTVTNSTTKSNYLIVDDVKDIIIYNIGQKKVMRTVSHKDGSLRTDIFPAKEGHIMVREYNKKEKYTRLSIETL